MKQVLLIRHAESKANVGHKTSTPQDIELTDLGNHQAHVLVDRICQKPDLIITSAFIRTSQTAAPLIARFPDTPCEQWPVHEFTYLSPVRCHNTTMEERIPLATEYWTRSDPDYCDGDGAESFADFITRVCSTKVKLMQRPERIIVVFSHCQFIRALQWIDGQSSPQPITAEDMASFRQSLFANTIDNCQIVEYIN